MTQTELKDFLLCTQAEVESLQKYVKLFFGDYYNYLVKQTIIEHGITHSTLEEIFYVFDKMGVKNEVTSVEFVFIKIGYFADKGFNSYEIVGELMSLWAYNILDNRSE